MRITLDTITDMGYIYLMPFLNKKRKSEKKLLKNKKKLELQDKQIS